MNEQQLQAYTELHILAGEMGRLTEQGEALEWYKEIDMPESETDKVAKEMAETEALLQTKQSNPHIGDLLDTLHGAHLNEDQSTLVRRMTYDFNRLKRVPAQLAADMADNEARAGAKWSEAREANDFAIFQPYLQKVFDQARERAGFIDASADPYEVILQDYEPGMTQADAERVLGGTRKIIAPIIERASHLPQADATKLKRRIQQDIELKALEAMAQDLGYDFGYGRIAFSKHPFTVYRGRISTNSDKGWVFGILNLIHELGHAAYDQNRIAFGEDYFTPIGGFPSMSTHESQSVIFEYAVGNEPAFWERHLPLLKKAYAPVIDDVEVEDVLKGIYNVKLGPVRLEADQVTYSPHIILRYEIEKQIIGGQLDVKDVPEAWNAMSQEMLGVTPTNLAEGCLQDDHWTGAQYLGYFPTYVYGHMAAAQLLGQAKQEMPNLANDIRNGDLTGFREFNNRTVHSHGERYGFAELIKNATGKDFGAESYAAHLNSIVDRLEQLYSR